MHGSVQFPRFVVFARKVAFEGFFYNFLPVL
jgi:hypothetical protein